MIRYASEVTTERPIAEVFSAIVAVETTPAGWTSPTPAPYCLPHGSP
jgi:hypothetical protein